MHGIQSKPPSDIMFKQNAISPNQEKIKVSLSSRSKERLLSAQWKQKKSQISWRSLALSPQPAFSLQGKGERIWDRDS